jgi:selenocysteine-specific elongation factor
VKIRQAFESVLDFAPRAEGTKPLRVLLDAGGRRGRATLEELGPDAVSPGGRFARFDAELESPVKWGDAFEVLSAAGVRLGAGTVLHPGPPEAKRPKPERRLDLLRRLKGGGEDMLLAFAEERGVHGLRAEEVEVRSRLAAPEVEEFARRLEEAGRIRILSFDPLFLVARDSLDFLEARILEFVGQYHEREPGRSGAPLEEVRKRFGVSGPVLRLATSGLVRRGRLRLEDGAARLPGFRIPLTSEEEAVLEELERLAYEGEFYARGLEEIRKKFRLTPSRFETLMTVLAERKKFLRGKDGFYLSAQWLDEVVAKVRDHAGPELTVADFKALTGLSRKFSIPLLELLDEMGVTRRVGPSRVVVGEGRKP